jgi:hypothetical protein
MVRTFMADDPPLDPLDITSKIAYLASYLKAQITKAGTGGEKEEPFNFPSIERSIAYLSLAGPNHSLGLLRTKIQSPCSLCCLKPSIAGSTALSRDAQSLLRCELTSAKSSSQ